MGSTNESNATDQAKKIVRKPSPINGQVLPPGFEAHPERRNPGGWRKEDTARYKLEKMISMTEDEIIEIANDHNASLVERRIARSLLKENEWKTTEAVINQVYGSPKQRIEVEPIQPKPLIDLTQPEQKK